MMTQRFYGMRRPARTRRTGHSGNPLSMVRHLMATAALLLGSTAAAQTAPPANVQMQNGQPRAVTPTASQCYDKVNSVWTGCAANGGAVQESFQLVGNNVPSAPATVYGGSYIFSQTCTAYGTLTLQVLGPDGSTWLTVTTKTASDANGGTGVALGSFARMRVTVSGTTGCNALLARVPS